MSIESFIGLVVAAFLGWLIPNFLRKTVGTKYVTEQECDECHLRAAVDEIKMLVIELAIKAGVPANEVAKLAKRPPV